MKLLSILILITTLLACDPGGEVLQASFKYDNDLTTCTCTVSYDSLGSVAHRSWTFDHSIENRVFTGTSLQPFRRAVEIVCDSMANTLGDSFLYNSVKCE